MQLELLL